MSSVIVPAGGGAFLSGLMKNHVARNTSEAAAGVGLGDGAGLGDGPGLGVGFGEGVGIGVGVGVGPGVLLETEPQPASKSKNPVKRIKATVRTKTSWNLAFIQEGELI